MRAAVVLATVVLGIALAVPAQADLDKGTYAPDIEAGEWVNTDHPVSLAELRGMTVVLFFWVSWHEGGEAVMPLMNLVNSNVGRQRGVYLIGVTDSTRARIEPALKKEKVFFPVAADSKSYQEYKISSFPRVVVIDPGGKVAWSDYPAEGGGDKLIKVVEEILDDSPPTRTHPEELVIVERKMDEARKAMQEQDYEKANKAAGEALEHALGGDPVASSCQEMQDLAESLGRDQLALAERAADEKDYAQAISLLQTIQDDFHGLNVARSAKRKLDTLRKRYEEVGRLLARQGEAAQAEAALARALEDLRATPRRIGPARDTLRDIIKDFPKTEAAAKARTVLDRMEKDVLVMDYVRDYEASQECETLLSQARFYVSAGQGTKAKELFRRVIDEHRDTIWADIAAKELAQLP